MRLTLDQLKTRNQKHCIQVKWLEEKPDVNYNFEAGEKPGVGEDSVEETETKLMSEAEKEEFIKEMQATVEAFKNLWPG